MKQVTVLVVEDDGTTRDLIDVALQLEGAVEQVRATGTADEALRIAPEFDPDIVVVDSLAKVSGGAEVGPRLRELVPNARIISFSGTDRVVDWADESIVKDGTGIQKLTAAIARTSYADFDRDALGKLIHDLRNPIGALLGFSHLLVARRAALSDEQFESVIDGVARSAQALAEMVNELADRRKEI
jgi:CheY-like chemotaxis protein